MSPGIVAESDLSRNLKSEYVFFHWRQARKDFSSGAISYYFSDRLKTASVITDSAGNIKGDEDFCPRGDELPLVKATPTNTKFTGKKLKTAGLVFTTMGRDTQCLAASNLSHNTVAQVLSK